MAIAWANNIAQAETNLTVDLSKFWAYSVSFAISPQFQFLLFMKVYSHQVPENCC